MLHEGMRARVRLCAPIRLRDLPRLMLNLSLSSIYGEVKYPARDRRRTLSAWVGIM